MPATILSTAGFDILRDAGRAYARRLESEGVSVLYLNFPSLNHSFLQASGVIADADRAATDTARIFGAAIRSRAGPDRSEEHTSELQSLIRLSYAVFCLQKKKRQQTRQHSTN